MYNIDDLKTFEMIAETRGVTSGARRLGISPARTAGTCTVWLAVWLVPLGALWAALGDELKVSTNMQRLGRWSPLLNLVVRRAARNPAIGELLSGMIANAVPKKQLTNPLFYLRLLFR